MFGWILEVTVWWLALVSVELGSGFSCFGNFWFTVLGVSDVFGGCRCAVFGCYKVEIVVSSLILGFFLLRVFWVFAVLILALFLFG